MITALALLAVLSAPDAAAVAAPAKSALPIGADAFTLRGKGMRSNFTLGGAISRSARGRVRGDFVIIITTPTDTSTLCRYRKFTKVVRNGGTVTFDATGDCVTVAPSGAITDWKASNAFAVVQGNGKTPDTIDVNMYGSNGITIPGGTLDSGEFELQ